MHFQNKKKNLLLFFRAGLSSNAEWKMNFLVFFFFFNGPAFFSWRLKIVLFFKEKLVAWFLSISWHWAPQAGNFFQCFIDKPLLSKCQGQCGCNSEREWLGTCSHNHWGLQGKFARKRISMWVRIAMQPVYTEQEKSNDKGRSVKWELEHVFAGCESAIAGSVERQRLEASRFVTAEGWPADFRRERWCWCLSRKGGSHPCSPRKLTCQWKLLSAVLCTEQGCERDVCQLLLLI